MSPPDRDQRLARLWREGLTIAVIGERLGMAPALVAATRRRLGLPPRHAATRAPAAGAQAATSSAAAVATARRQTAASARPLRLVQDAPRPVAEPVAPRCCAWPMWSDFSRPTSPRFCGAPATDGTYCAEHHALAYRQRGEPWRKLPPASLLGRLLAAA